MASKRDKLLASAQKHVRKGNWERAIKDYQGVVDIDPDDVRTMLKIADLHVKLGSFEEALVGYQSVAYHYAQQDIYDKAVAVYKQALRVEPENPRLHRDLGEAYYRHGRLKDAIRAFHQAQKLFRTGGDSANQRDVLERMVKIDPDDVGLKIQLAERYEKDGLRAEALDHFQEGAERLYEEGRLDEYIQVGERIIYLEPSLVELRKRIVRLYLDRNDNKHALKHLQVLFKERPDDVETLESLALTFARLGNTDKAVLVYMELALAFQGNGHTHRAEEIFRRILELNPNHPEARAALGARARVDSRPGPPDTANIAPEPEEEVDALDGIEFLDDDEDDAVEFEPAPTAKPDVPDVQAVAGSAMGDEFLAFAEEELGDLGSDILESLDENPASSVASQRRGGGDAIPVATIEAEPIGDDLTAAEVRQLLQESDVFLKYGLMDRAWDTISRCVRAAPNNVQAREQMYRYYDKAGELSGAGNELFELARLTRATPQRAAAYLRRAMDYVNPAIVVAKSEELNVSLDTPGGDARIQDLDHSFIEEVSHGIDEASEVAAPEQPSVVEFLPMDDEDEEEEVAEALSIDPADTVDLPFDNDFSVEQEEGIVDMTDFIEEEGEISDPIEIVVDEVDVAFDEQELKLVDEEIGELEIEFTSDDADRMFDELFGTSMGRDDDSGALGGAALNAMSDMAEIDFYIEQGLSSEAEDALEKFAAAHPDHEGLEARATKIAGMQGAAKGGVNPFGERSLSMKFAPEFSMAEESLAINNSNLELGHTYRDMSLWQEAIDEYKQALEDPEASSSALYNIAVCELELNNVVEAENILTTLSRDENAPASLRQSAEERLQDLRRERVN